MIFSFDSLASYSWIQTRSNLVGVIPFTFCHMFILVLSNYVLGVFPVTLFQVQCFSSSFFYLDFSIQILKPSYLIIYIIYLKFARFPIPSTILVNSLFITFGMFIGSLNQMELSQNGLICSFLLAVHSALLLIMIRKNGYFSDDYRFSEKKDLKLLLFDDHWFIQNPLILLFTVVTSVIDSMHFSQWGMGFDSKRPLTLLECRFYATQPALHFLSSSISHHSLFTLQKSPSRTNQFDFCHFSESLKLFSYRY